MTTLITSNEEMDDIIKIVNSFEKSDLLIKGLSKTIKNKAKEEKRWISQHVVRYIRGYFIRDLLTGILVMRPGPDTIRTSQKYFLNF